jgi:hypothetical protein
MKHRFNVHRFLAVLALCEVALFVAGCNLPAWISTAQSILPIAGQMAAAVLALVAAFSGSTDSGAITTLSTVVSAAAKALTDIQAMVTEYASNPSTTLLGDIENGIKAVSDNIAPFLADTGIKNSALSAKVVAILQLLMTEVTSLASIMPLLKATAGQTLSVTIPFDAKQFKQAYNEIVDKPTGDVAVDAALAKLPRL